MTRAVQLGSGGDDLSLDLYLQEIGRFPLLSREGEVALAVRIQAGEEEALDTLIRSNLRFVVSVAKRYQHQGVSLGDLINEGNLGLIRAAQKFDPGRGIKFISYAVWWIRQSILQALADHSRIVRVPVNRASELHRIGRCTALLQQELGRDPTPAEIAEGSDLELVQVEAALVFSRSHLSLDAPIVEGEERNRLFDCLADPQGQGPDAEVFEHALAERIDASVRELGEREARILKLYFGLDTTEPRTLEEIGALLGITRERVRQIKEKALEKLRGADATGALASFLG